MGIKIEQILRISCTPCLSSDCSPIYHQNSCYPPCSVAWALHVYPLFALDDQVQRRMQTCGNPGTTSGRHTTG